MSEKEEYAVLFYPFSDVWALVGTEIEREVELYQTL
jgi:hypothetical protein